ncbi:hypothetical protein [Saccharopolyspora spinosa]|nr:hypothetical protein [Saccharopolyspora spinosa]
MFGPAGVGVLLAIRLPADAWLCAGGFLAIFVIGGSVALVRFTGCWCSAWA